jgi:single-strand DNA-binding protein
MKNITIAGRLTKDAELRNTQSGDSVLGFSVAVDDRSSREKGTMYFDCSMWGTRGEKVAAYLTKGSSVTVTGDLGKREHDGKTHLTVRVAELTLQGSKSEGAREHQQEERQFAKQERRAVRQDIGDDIPF